MCYCVKCRKKVKVIKEYVDLVQNDKGFKKLMRANCSICSSRVSKYIKNNPDEVQSD